jgi:hypothetical protein
MKHGSIRLKRSRTNAALRFHRESAVTRLSLLYWNSIWERRSGYPGLVEPGFFSQLVQGEFPGEDVLLEGRAGTSESALQTTRLSLASETLRLSGFVEVLEERPGLLIPVEYVQGMQGQWLQEHLHLCAQALCLEKHQPGQPPIPYGYLVVRETSRQVKVMLTPTLRANTRASLTRAHRFCLFGRSVLGSTRAKSSLVPTRK